MAIKARIWWDDTATAYVVSVPYKEAFVDALKQLIPSGDRNYDPQTKFWYVKEGYGSFIRQLAENAFGMSSVSFTSKDVAQQARSFHQQRSSTQGSLLTPGTGSTEDAIVAFFNLLPYDAAKRAYLIAAQTYHPDKPSGDGQKMSKLNELWDRIEKEFYKR